MRHYLKSICLGGAAIAVLGVAGCAHDKFMDRLDKDQVGKICKQYCSASAGPQTPGFAVMMKKTFVNGQPTYVPMREVLIQSFDNDGRPSLVTPYEATYGASPGGDSPPVINKSAGLDPACFAKEPYATPDLSDIVLDASNTTITFVNFDRNGRLESRDMSSTDPVYGKIADILSQSGSGDYTDIQRELMDMGRPAANDLFSNVASLTNRDLIANATPKKKTPFYTNLKKPTFSDATGHVFFYVLLDSHLYFSRDNAALITYAPAAENALETFYTPFVQYPVVPDVSDMDDDTVDEPDGSQMDVLTFHFIRDVANGGADVDECRYVYDKYVISKGQDTYSQRTPLFIDPEVTTRGVIAQ